MVAMASGFSPHWDRKPAGSLPLHRLSAKLASSDDEPGGPRDGRAAENRRPAGRLKRGGPPESRWLWFRPSAVATPSRNQVGGDAWSHRPTPKAWQPVAGRRAGPDPHQLRRTIHPPGDPRRPGDPLSRRAGKARSVRHREVPGRSRCFKTTLETVEATANCDLEASL
jgi:hypothetical protein